MAVPLGVCGSTWRAGTGNHPHARRGAQFPCPRCSQGAAVEEQRDTWLGWWQVTRRGSLCWAHGMLAMPTGLAPQTHSQLGFLFEVLAWCLRLSGISCGFSCFSLFGLFFFAWETVPYTCFGGTEMGKRLHWDGLYRVRGHFCGDSWFGVSLAGWWAPIVAFPSVWLLPSCSVLPYLHLGQQEEFEDFDLLSWAKLFLACLEDYVRRLILVFSR